MKKGEFIYFYHIWCLSIRLSRVIHVHVWDVMHVCRILIVPRDLDKLWIYLHFRVFFNKCLYLCPSKSPSITCDGMRQIFVSLGSKSLNKPSKEICFDDLGIVQTKLNYSDKWYWSNRKYSNLKKSKSVVAYSIRINIKKINEPMMTKNMLKRIKIK